jgi:hypothetical protein
MIDMLVVRVYHSHIQRDACSLIAQIMEHKFQLSTFPEITAENKLQFGQECSRIRQISKGVKKYFIIKARKYYIAIYYD